MRPLLIESMRQVWWGLIIVICSWALAAVAIARDLPGLDRAACTYRGRLLQGRVQIVEQLADLKLEVVASSPDLRVRIANSPDQCGEWQFVEQFGQLRVQFVEQFADLKIQFVARNPGF